MSPTVGFIILTHNKPHQTIRLINTLNRMFDFPPIVCHHDFSKSDFSVDALTKNILLVHPHLQTAWGKFSVVDAMLSALKLMYKTSMPDWFILLSGADYPIKSARQILYDLGSSPYDVHIHHEQIKYNDYEGAWQELCFERYCVIKYRMPVLSRKLRLINIVLTIKNPYVTAPFLPFSTDLRCFAGAQWFCANRKAAEYLTEFHSTRPALASHYRRLDPYSIAPDESYCQTIFGNAPHLKVSHNNWRYVDWSIGGSHPKTLLFDDLPKINASPAHFARKFDIDVDIRVLNELDVMVGLLAT